jgi:hypothetical protein
MKALLQKYMKEVSVITMMLNDNNYTIYVVHSSQCEHKNNPFLNHVTHNDDNNDGNSCNKIDAEI